MYPTQKAKAAKTHNTHAYAYTHTSTQNTPFFCNTYIQYFYITYLNIKMCMYRQLNHHTKYRRPLREILLNKINIKLLSNENSLWFYVLVMI